MNTFRQRIPAFVDIGPAPTQNFEGTQQLLNLEVVKRYSEDASFSHFALSKKSLMAISHNGYHWWVIGYIGDPASIELPPWDGGKFHARLPDGQIVDLTGRDVYSSCGDVLTLRDGTTAINLGSDYAKRW